ncbi:MAG: hypothetical protein Kow00105_18090 [Phycisphaeraceae bacterium]
MCLEHDNQVRLVRCPHGAFHLRVANTTLHLTHDQVIALHAELNRCVRTGPDAPHTPAPNVWRHHRFGQSLS